MLLKDKILLVKFPTRERPSKAIKVLQGYINNAYDNKNIIYLVSYDKDDYSMNNETVLRRFQDLHKNVVLCAGHSLNKINAYNRDMENIKNWDILIAASDDMISVKKFWDSQIKSTMQIMFPDDDGVLYFNDGFVGERLNTLPILTRKYYDRFSYVYNPSYKSLWADNEFMEVANKLKRQIYISDVLFKHEHYCNIRGVPDNLMRRTETYFNQDKQTFLKRKKTNFGLNV